MKKTLTTSSKRSKLSLNAETVRTLTSQDLSLVVGGACQHASVKSQTVPVNLPVDATERIPRPDIPTCS
jgi:hypothetical protein